MIDEAGARARLASQVPPAEVADLKDGTGTGQPGEGERGPRPELRAGGGAPRHRARPAEPDPAPPGGVGAGAADPAAGDRRGGRVVHRLSLDRHPARPGCRRPRPTRLLRMEDELHQAVVGQDEAIKAVSPGHPAEPRRTQGSATARSARSSSRGPTGVGKTELARALAQFLFADAQALIRVDMSEYMEKFSVSRLIGAPPGYVGYEDSGAAHQGGAPAALLGGAPRRDREGAPRRLQHPAAGARRRAPDRQLRPGRSTSRTPSSS